MMSSPSKRIYNNNNNNMNNSSSAMGIIRIHHHGSHGSAGSAHHGGSGSSPSSSSGSPSPPPPPCRAADLDLLCRAERSAPWLHTAGSPAEGGGGGDGGSGGSVIQAGGGSGGGSGSVQVLSGSGGGQRSLFEGNERSFGGGGGEMLLQDMEKTGCPAQEDQRDRGVLKRASPTHCLSKTTANGGPTTTANGDGLAASTCPIMHLDFRKPSSGKQRNAEPLANGFHHHLLLHQQGASSPPGGEERQLSHPSGHIPVPPRHRKSSGHADKEVMAATVLTSLSTSPLVLHTASTVPESSSRGWSSALSASYSSSTSGNWSWDACSDQSVPSTPSPPLSSDHAPLLLAKDGFLLSSSSSSHADDVISEDNAVTDGTHFLFEDPIPRKRKNSMKVMFKCLWKNCEKVLSTSSGMQRHVRTVHLGRSSDSDLSDGEEDFYYSEIEVNVDSLTEGLSSLTPTSPTTAAPPPFFPPHGGGAALTPFFPSVPRSEHIAVIGQSLSQAPPLLLPVQDHHPAPTLLSQSAPSTLCHIRTDHAYQGPVSNVRTVSIGEKRQPASTSTPPHPPSTKNHALTSAVPKPAPGARKPRGEAKKCRKVYGMEKRDMWCTACRWKKACQRFTD